MLLFVLLATVAALLHPVRATPFQPRGNQTAPGRLPPHAPSYRSSGELTPTRPVLNWNLTAPTPSLSPAASTPDVATTRPPYPTGSAVSPFAQPLAAPSSNSGSDAPCTVNVPQANVYWWYLATYEWQVGTLRTAQGNYNDTAARFTNEPNPDSFDVTSALADIAITLSESYDADWDMTFSYPDPYLVTPSATLTSVVSRIAFSPLPPGSTIREEDLPLYTTDIFDVGPASVEASGTAVTSATPFVVISQYEVVSALSNTAAEGFWANSTAATQTYVLSQSYMYPYWVKSIEDSAVASGTVPSDLLLQIPHASCVAGALSGSVTVLVVVDVFYFRAPNANPFRVHLESTVLGWDDTGPTVDIKATNKPPEPPEPTDRTYGLPHVEQPASGFSDEPTTLKPVVLQTDSGTPSPSPTGVSAGPEQHTVGSIHSVPVIVGPDFKVRIGSQTLTGGSAPITVAGEIVSLDSSGRLVVGGSSTSSIPGIIALPTPSYHTVGSVGTAPVVVGPSSVVVIGSETLSKGGPPITVGGKPVSLDSGGHAIVVDGSKTSQLPPVSVVGNPAPRPPPVLTLGTVTVTGNAATQFFLAPGQTLTPGGTASLGGAVVSLDSSALFVVVEGTTHILPAPPPSIEPVKPTIVVGALTFTQQAGSSFVIGTETLTQDGNPVTIGSTALSLGPDYVVVDGYTSRFTIPSPVRARPEITLPASTVTANELGTFVIDGKTLAVNGQPITLNGGITLSLAAFNVLVSDGISTTLENPSAITLAPSGITSNENGAFVIDGHILTVGAPAITLSSGDTLSLLAPDVIVINGETSTFAAQTAHTTSPPLPIGDRVFTPLPGSASAYLIGTEILTPGGFVEFEGTIISLAPGATAVVVNGVTTTLAAQVTITNAPLLTIGSETFAAISGTTYLVHGQTLTPGGTVTYDGTTVSLSPNATRLSYGSEGTISTETLFPATIIPTSLAASKRPASAHATFSASAPTATARSAGARVMGPSGIAYGLLTIGTMLIMSVLG